MPSERFPRFTEGTRPENTNGGGPAKLRYIAILAAIAGLAFAARGTIAIFGEVRYWSPETPRDYAAVALTSLALLFLGATLWAMGKQNLALPTGRAARLSRFAVHTAAVAAVVVSASNFLEDYLRLRWFGTTFVIGSLVLLLAMMAGTVSTFVATPENPTGALLFLAITIGILLLGVSMFITAVLLLLVAGYHVRLERQGSGRGVARP